MHESFTSSDVRQNALLQYWEKVRLDSFVSAATNDAQSTESFADLKAILPDILALSFGGRGEVIEGRRAGPVQARTVPSAGALYPYEIFVCVPEGLTRENTYLFRPDQNSLVAYGATCASEMARCAEISQRLPNQPDAVVVIASRPWLSMKKYGDRGYIYSTLDAGHAVFGLVAACKALNIDASVFIDIDKHAVIKALDLDNTCIQPVAAISLKIANNIAVNVPLGKGRWERDGRAVLEKPEADERNNWDRLLHPIHERGIAQIPHPLEVTESLFSMLRSVSDNDPSEKAATISTPSIETIYARRSVRGFQNAPVEIKELQKFCKAIDARALTDFAKISAGISAHLALVRGEDDEPCIYQINDAGLVKKNKIIDKSDIASILRERCMNQKILKNLAGLIVLHAPAGQFLAGSNTNSFQAIHYHAAHVAQQMSLAAVDASFGITCIGGFDGRKLSKIFAFSDDEEIIYVLALGIPEDCAVKLDREAVPWAHGGHPSDSKG